MRRVGRHLPERFGSAARRMAWAAASASSDQVSGRAPWLGSVWSEWDDRPPFTKIAAYAELAPGAEPHGEVSRSRGRIAQACPVQPAWVSLSRSVGATRRSKQTQHFISTSTHERAVYLRRSRVHGETIRRRRSRTSRRATAGDHAEHARGASGVPAIRPVERRARARVALVAPAAESPAAAAPHLQRVRIRRARRAASRAYPRMSHRGRLGVPQPPRPNG